MEDRLKYFRGQIVPGNPDTLVYWADRWDGESFDIHLDDIPDGAEIVDVTDSRKEVIYVKDNGVMRHNSPC